MSERVMLQGILAEKRLEIKKLIAHANAIVSSIHTQCSPFLPLDDLPVDQIAEQAIVLEKIMRNIGHIKPEIRKLERELGIEEDR